jgi:hypothetical protein
MEEESHRFHLIVGVGRNCRCLTQAWTAKEFHLSALYCWRGPLVRLLRVFPSSTLAHELHRNPSTKSASDHEIGHRVAKASECACACMEKQMDSERLSDFN